MTDLRIEEFPSDNSEWIVVEHGRISWNQKLPDEPLVEICLSKLTTNETRVVRISKSFTLYATRGSVWLNGSKVSEIEQVCEMEISVPSLTRRALISAWSFVRDVDFNGRIVRKFYIPPHDYVIPKEFKDCPYWIFNDDTGIEVIISHLALFDGIFGHSARAKQIVFNHTATDTIERMEFKGFRLEDYEAQPSESEVVLGLNKDIRDNDRYFLYHLKVSLEAQKAVNGLNAQLNRSLNRNEFVQVNPWFNDGHYWKVKGLWLSRGERFLVLQILNFKYPPSPDFFVIRQNHNIQAEQFEKERKSKPRNPGNSNNKPNGSSTNRPSPGVLPTEIQLSAEDEVIGGTQIRKAVPKENKTRNIDAPPVFHDFPTISTSSMNESKSDTGKGDLTRTQSNEDEQEQNKPRPVPNAVNLILAALKVLCKGKGPVFYLSKDNTWRDEEVACFG